MNRPTEVSLHHARLSVRNVLGGAVADRDFRRMWIFDAIYYPKSEVRNPLQNLLLPANQIGSSLTSEDLRRMSASDAIVSGDDENPHGIIDENLCKIVQRPRESGRIIGRYENLKTGDHHVLWIASRQDTGAILEARKRCVSVAFETTTYSEKGSAVRKTDRVMDHVALLDDTKNPPFFKECQVVAGTPISNEDLRVASRLAVSKTYALGVVRRALAAAGDRQDAPATQGHCAGQRSAAADPARRPPPAASCTGARHRIANMSEQQQSAAANKGNESTQSLDQSAIFAMIRSNEPDQLKRAMEQIEKALSNAGVSVNATIADMTKLTEEKFPNNSAEANEVLSDLVTLQALYNNAQSAVSQSQPPAPMDTSSDASSNSNSQQQQKQQQQQPPNDIPMSEYQAVYQQTKQMADTEKMKMQALIEDLEKESGQKFDMNLSCASGLPPSQELQLLQAISGISAYSLKAAKKIRKQGTGRGRNLTGTLSKLRTPSSVPSQQQQPQTQQRSASMTEAGMQQAAASMQGDAQSNLRSLGSLLNKTRPSQL